MRTTRPAAPVAVAMTAVVLLTSLASAQQPAPPADSFELRRDAYLARVRAEPVKRFKVENGQIAFVTPDPGKHVWNNLIALLEADPAGNTKLPGSEITVRQMISAQLRFPNVFHFNCDGPAVAFYRYPQAIDPADRAFFFEGHKKSVLDHAADPVNNLFDGEGTENHIGMARFTGYLFCQNWLADHPNDDRAKRGLELCKRYILSRARDVITRGTGEWNSSTYYGYQLRGILSCYTYAKDPQVKDACRAMLDFFAAEMALKYVNGINAAPESRGGAKQSAAAEPDQIAALWWGDSPLDPSESTSAIYAAVSDYRPPAMLAKVARKEIDLPQTYLNSQPTYLIDRGAFSREVFYVDRSFALSSVQLPVLGMTGASVQFRPTKLVSRSTKAGESAWVLFGNSSTRTTDGGGRGPWDQWAQADQVLIQMTRVPPNAAELVATAKAITEHWQKDWSASHHRRWGAKLDGASRITWGEPKIDGVFSYLTFPNGAAVDVTPDAAHGVTFLRHGDTFVAVRSLGGAMPKLTDQLDPKSKGWSWLVDELSGGTGGFVVEVSSTREFPAFDAFRTTVVEKTKLDCSQVAQGRVTYTDLRGRTLAFAFNDAAQQPLIEPLFDWGYIADPAQDVRRERMTSPPFTQPTFPAAGEPLSGWGRVPTLLVDGQPVGGPDFLDLAKPWPVFKGPNVSCGPEGLRVRVGADEVQVAPSEKGFRFAP